jgi:hypothetical protein
MGVARMQWPAGDLLRTELIQRQLREGPTRGDVSGHPEVGRAFGPGGFGIPLCPAGHPSGEMEWQPSLSPGLDHVSKRSEPVWDVDGRELGGLLNSEF